MLDKLSLLVLVAHYSIDIMTRTIKLTNCSHRQQPKCRILIKQKKNFMKQEDTEAEDVKHNIAMISDSISWFSLAYVSRVTVLS